MLFGLIFLGSIIFVIIRLSISCLFWYSKKSKDKQHVFKIYFPYYIITLFGLCAMGIIKFNGQSFAIYFFGSLYFLTLIIWRYIMKYRAKQNHIIKKSIEIQTPNLP